MPSSAGRPTAIYLGWSFTEVSCVVQEILARQFDIVFVRHNDEEGGGDQVDQAALADQEPDFLFSFGPVIVRRPLLDRTRRGAINFHTGPPRWPGVGAASCALLAGDRVFGVTAHLMTPQVDAGPILRVHRFPVADDDDLPSLARRTLAEVPVLASAVVDGLRVHNWVPRPIDEAWERRAVRRADLDQAMRLSPGAPADEVTRMVRAFAFPGSRGPYLDLAGRRFWYLDPR